jgi:uncharacterized coiled-coil protein SlyX
MMMRALRNIRRPICWALAVLGTGLVVSCSTSKKETPAEKQASAIAEWNKAVAKHIPDEQRAQTLRELGHQMIAMQQTLMDELNDLNDQVAQLNISYDTSKAEIDQIYSAFTQKKNASLEQYRDILFAMRKQTSEHEWKALVN